MKRVAPLLVLLAIFLIGCGDRTTAPVTLDPPLGPALAEADFRFAVVGDFGTGDDAEYQVAQAIHSWVGASSGDALLTTGDNVYPDGSPDTFGRAWADPYGWVSRESLEVIGTLGNHDVATEGGEPVMSLFGMPGRWYATTIEDADIFVLDANDPSNEEQRAWLEQELAASKTRWQIAVFHQPAFSCSEHDGDPEVQASWVPLFERYGVDLVLNGHDHTYQRFEGPGGTAYVVTGGGGAGLYGLDGCDETTPRRVVGDDENHHFVTVEGSSEELRVRALGIERNVIDDFTIPVRTAAFGNHRGRKSPHFIYDSCLSHVPGCILR